MPNWTIQQQKYQLWLAAPNRSRPRNLRSRKTIAEKLGVSVPTLRRWETEPRWWDAVFQQARAIIGRRLAGILDAMATAAEGGSVNAAKLCLEVLGVHHKRIQHDVDVRGDQLVVILHGDALPSNGATPSLPQTQPLAQLPQSTNASAQLIDVLPTSPTRSEPASVETR